MKKLIFLLVTIASAYSPFCNGFKAGYKAGYCYGKALCLEPLAPLCPLPWVGQNSYSDGYDRGFVLGLSKKR